MRKVSLTAALALTAALYVRSRRPNFRPLYAVLIGAVRVAPGSRSFVQKRLLKHLYEGVNRRLNGSGTTLLNYGFAPPDDPHQDLGLSPDSEPDRFGIQLYSKVASAVDLRGKEVLEIGCGRGGGTAFVFERHRPKSMTGLDLADSAIEHCRSVHAAPRLTFVTGDAEDLPFAGGSFDAVLNVESSHCYPDMNRFLAEVRRVLRPGGVLLLADLRHTRLELRENQLAIPQEDVPRLREQIAASGFTVLQEEDITAGIDRALRLDSARRRALVERTAPRAMRSKLLEFAAVEGTGLQRAFADHSVTYLRYVLEKP